MTLLDELTKIVSEESSGRRRDERIIDWALRVSDDQTADMLHRVLRSNVSPSAVAEALTRAGFPVGKTAVSDYRRKLRQEGV